MWRGRNDLLFLVFFFFFFFGQFSNAELSTERAHLKDVFDGLSKLSRKVLRTEGGWDFSSSVCNVNSTSGVNSDWLGISCSDDGSFITKIELSFPRGLNQPGAHLSVSIGNILHLAALQICNAELSMTIPSSIGNLVSLESLDLSSNLLSGTIPSQISGSSALTLLSLWDNKLTGSIPRGLAQLPSLVSLFLKTNKLAGSIPTFTSALKNVQLYDNALTGPLPPIFPTTVEQLLVHDNSITGTLPSSFSHLSLLRFFDCSQNSMTGSLTQLWSLPKLVYLNVSENYFSGQVLSTIKTLMGVGVLDLHSNYITGTLPTEIGSLTALAALNLHKNRLTGVIPIELTRLAKLQSLTLDDNFLVGPIPNAIGLLSNLKLLNLSYNNLETSLPSSLSTLTALRIFDVGRNSLTGSISDSFFSQMPALQLCSLSQNSFSGSIPSSLLSHEAIITLKLNHNKFTAVPSGLQPVANLIHLNVGNNRIQGLLPGVFFTYPKLATFIASTNCFRGSLPSEICRASAMRTLIMNGLTANCASSSLFTKGNIFGFNGRIDQPNMLGAIPPCAYSLQNISSLQLSDNGFVGSLPTRYASSLADLCLSFNLITGEMPSELLKISGQFEALDAQFNRISGSLSSISALPQKSFNFVVNRLSGLIPNALVDAEGGNSTAVSILEGNMFSCSFGPSRDGLPPADPYYLYYQCASKNFYYVFAFFCTAIILFAQLQITRHLIKYRHLHKLLQLPVTGERDLDQYTKSLSRVRNFSLGLIAVFVIVYIPIYVSLSQSFGTYESLYVFSTSAAFKSGVPAAATLLGLWCSSLLGVVFFLRVFFGKVVGKKTDGAHAEQLETTIEVVSPCALALRIAVSLLIGGTVSLLGNCVYVAYVSKKQESMTVFLLQCGLAIWKLMVHNSLVRIVQMKEVKQLRFGTPILYPGAIDVLFALLVFNTVLAPCWSTAFVSSKCFRSIFYATEPVRSHYQDVACQSRITYFWGYHNSQNSYYIRAVSEDSSCVETRVTAEYSPSFRYNYECSSYLVEIYSPIFMLVKMMVVFDLIAYVVVKALLRVVHRKWATLRGILLMSTSRLLLQSEERNERLQLLESLAMGRGSLLLRLFYRFSTNDEENVLHANQVFFTIMNDLVIMLSFGTVFPLLGLAVGITLCMKMFSTHYLMVKFLENTQDPVFAGERDLIHKEVQGNMKSGSIPLYNISFFLNVFLSFFYSLFLLDIAADGVGIREAIWVPFLMVSVPISLHCALHFCTPAGYANYFVGYFQDLLSRFEARFVSAETGISFHAVPVYPTVSPLVYTISPATPATAPAAPCLVSSPSSASCVSSLERSAVLSIARLNPLQPRAASSIAGLPKETLYPTHLGFQLERENRHSLTEVQMARNLSTL